MSIAPSSSIASASQDSSTQVPGTPRPHRRDIDGLRAIAILSVLFFHAAIPGFSGGYVGVDVFFVISGYLICGILLRDIEAGHFSIGRFYERRCKRILPALFLVLASCLLFGYFFLSPSEFAGLGKGTIATSLSASNILFYLQGSYFDRGGTLNPLLMTWSLAVEEQFYIFFPLLLLALQRLKKSLAFALVLLCAVSFAACIFFEFHHPELNFFSPFTRAWELGAGTILALLEHRNHKQSPLLPRVQCVAGPLGMLAVAACIGLYGTGVRFPGYEALPVVMGTAMLLASPESFINRLLHAKPFVWIGLISYSLYLWHWPLLSFAAIADGDTTSTHARLVLLAFSVLLAACSYRWIETPFRIRKTQSRPRLLATYAAALFLFVIAGIAIASTHGLPARAPQLATIESQLALNRKHSCIESVDHTPDNSPTCIPQFSATTQTAALLGDSHAEALAPALQQLLQQRGIRMVQRNAFSCPPLQGYTRVLPGQPTFAKDCIRFNQRNLQLLRERTDIQTVFLTGAWPMAADDIFAPAAAIANAAHSGTLNNDAYVYLGLRNEVEALRQAGKRVIVLDDVPSLSFVPLNTEVEQALPLRQWIAAHLVSRPATQQRSLPRTLAISSQGERLHQRLSQLQQAPNVLVYRLDAPLCSSSICHFGDADGLYYTDNSHLSLHGAQTALSQLAY